MPEQAERSFIPALRFRSLTPLFDPVVALTTRERAFKSKVLDRAALEDGDAILDLGCGTGTLAIAAQSRVPTASVVGLDADPDILRRARSKASAAGAEVHFDEGYSTDLPYDDSRFDVVISTLFFHHLRDADKRETLAEARRVIKPGGRLVLGDVGRPQGALMRAAALATVQLVDGRETTSANIEGRLPTVLAEAGFTAVSVGDRFRTPIGTLEVMTARQPAQT